MTAATQKLILLMTKALRWMQCTEIMLANCERNEHVSLENTVYCQLINLINDPLLKHES